MKNQRDTSLRIRLAGMAILGLFIALAAAAFFSGQQVKRTGELIATDAVPGLIIAHDMRMAMSRSVGFMMVAASAQTTQSRDVSIKIAHDADVAFTNAITQYQATIKINPEQDREMLGRVTSKFAEFHRQRMTYEALILAGNRDGSAAFLETNLVPAYVSATQSAEELLKYNNDNSITYANYIHNSVHRLYWTVAVVMVLAVVCAVVLIMSLSVRRREVKELRASEARFRTLIENAPTAISISRGNSTIYVNKKYLDLYGFKSVDEVTDCPVTDRWSPEFRGLIAKRIQQRARGEPVPNEYEGTGQRRDGSQFPVHVAVSSVELLDGKASLAFLTDMTERKRLEQKQVELAAIVASSDDAIIGKSLTGVITSWNRGAEKIFGYSAAEAIGQPLLMLMPADRRHEEAAVLEKIGRGETVEHYETVRIRKDGRQIFISATISPLKDGDGRVIGAAKIARDITEQKNAQDELVWKTAFLEAQVDSALDGILVVDARAKRILQNQHLIELFNVPDEIARDDDDANLLRHVTRQLKNPKEFVERVNHLYANPTEVGRDEIELADGRILDRYSAPVRNQAGKYYGRIWTFRDITGQRKLEEQFRQSQKMEAVGQLASGVAHDFNNILAVIQLQSEMLKFDGNLSPTQAGFAAEIGAAAQRAAALTRQLLLFSRKEKMQTRDLDLNQSIKDMTKMLQRSLGETVQLQLKCANQPLVTCADPGMLDQVLMNLAVNARDAMPKGGNLVIETSIVELDELSSAAFPQSRPGSFVCLSVSDTGTGIPPEIMPKIFEPFFTTKDIGKGTGLGLATVFGIVQQHQGWISVYSEVGYGTTFRIYLPRSARASADNIAPAATMPVTGGNETILLVEDESSLRASVRNVLARLGYNVLEAADGAAALEVCKNHRGEIHLLVTDMVMPGGMTGKELGRWLMQDNPKLKVIYVSGYSAELTGTDFPLEEGVNFLTKPFAAVKLAQTIRNRLDA